MAKLVIEDAYPEDSGDYSCEVSNEAGKQSANFHITVKGKFKKLLNIFFNISL